jgi:hypothetical protein
LKEEKRNLEENVKDLKFAGGVVYYKDKFMGRVAGTGKCFEGNSNK